MKKSIITVLAFTFMCLLFTNCVENSTSPDSNALDINQPDYGTSVPVIFEPNNLTSKAPKMGVWEALPDIPTEIEGGYCGVVDDFIMIACGFGGGDKTYIYDLVTKTWTSGADAPGFSSEGASATKNGLVYCVGGGAGNIFWTYDPVGDAWDDTLMQMPTSRGGLGVAIVDDYLYAIGGRPGAAGPKSAPPMSTVERYNILSDSWTTVASLPSARSDLSAIKIGGKIYVIGGFDAGGNPLNNVDVYDPNTDMWSTSPSDMPTARGGLYAVGSRGATIYAIGGWDGLEPFNVGAGSIGTIVESYKVSQDKWTISDKFSYMPTARGEACVVSTGGLIYLIGGSQPAFGNNVSSFESFNPNK